MNVIGTAGHVDHGKSTLVERLTGIDPDRFAEEKRRGLTIDLGFAWLTLPSGTEVGLIDVPGHERFIRNMLAGAGGMSVGLFVVAANEGWMPQSEEHLSIIDLLGISNGVVALTKSDTVDELALENARAEVETKIASSSLHGAPIVACSATTGQGIDDLVAALDSALRGAPEVTDLGRPRLWVDRVFTIAGAGTVVTGTLTGGSLRAGMEVEISPEGRRARVRTIQSHKKKVDEIAPGNRVALNIVGLEREGARRGDAIVQPKTWRPTTLIDAELRVVDARVSGHQHDLTEKGSHLLYIGSAETPVRVKLLGRDRLGPGERAFAQLTLRDALPIARGDRFVLRDAGRRLTFGGGEVLDPLPSRVGRSDPDRPILLQRLKDANPAEAMETLLEGEGALRAHELALRVGTDAPSPDGAVWLGDLLASRPFYERLRNDMRAALADHHADQPLEKGIARELLRSRLDLDGTTFDALVDSDPDVMADGPVVRLAAHGVSLAPEQQVARNELIERIESAGFTPPMDKELEVDPAFLRALVDGGDLVKIENFYLTSRQAQEARARVRSTIEAEGPVTVARIRDLLGTSRKYAVPLCEWFDSTGATRRQGDLRTLGPHP